MLVHATRPAASTGLLRKSREDRGWSRRRAAVELRNTAVAKGLPALPEPQSVERTMARHERGEARPCALYAGLYCEVYGLDNHEVAGPAQPPPAVTVGREVVGWTHDLDEYPAWERTVTVSLPIGRTFLLASLMDGVGETVDDVRAMTDDEFVAWALGGLIWRGTYGVNDTFTSPEFRNGYRDAEPEVAEFYCVVRDRLDRLFPFQPLEVLA